MAQKERAVIDSLVVSVEYFNQDEIECALELVDIYLNNKYQSDYRVVVAEDSESKVHAYACGGPVPLTKGTCDLCWIAAHPDSCGSGFGCALMANVEGKMLENNGRLLAVEASARESCSGAIQFYRSPGHEETARISDFYDVGDDKLIFMKRLP
jgi:ribosomal protein S18 acetylase RimI-like enzyme